MNNPFFTDKEFENDGCESCGNTCYPALIANARVAPLIAENEKLTEQNQTMRDELIYILNRCEELQPNSDWMYLEIINGFLKRIRKALAKCKELGD